jgi:hypothetical protein
MRAAGPRLAISWNCSLVTAAAKSCGEFHSATLTKRKRASGVTAR